MIEQSSFQELKQKKKVRFSHIEVRQYPMILGDNPSVSSGPALTIDWEYFSEAQFSIEHYDTIHKKTHRSTRHLIMPLSCRMLIAKNAGHSYREIRQCLKEMKEYKAGLRQESKPAIDQRSMKEKIFKKMNLALIKKSVIKTKKQKIAPQ